MALQSSRRALSVLHRPNSAGKVNLGTYPTAPIFGGKGSPGKQASTLGANLLVKKLRKLRTGCKRGDFWVLHEKSRTLWRERPKRTRAGFVPYCSARAIFASGRLAPNRKVTYSLARTFLADLAPYRLARGDQSTVGPRRRSVPFGAN